MCIISSRNEQTVSHLKCVTYFSYTFLQLDDIYQSHLAKCDVRQSHFVKCDHRMSHLFEGTQPSDSSVIEHSSGEQENHGSNPGLSNRYVRPEAALLYTPQGVEMVCVPWQMWAVCCKLSLVLSQREHKLGGALYLVFYVCQSHVKYISHMICD